MAFTFYNGVIQDIDQYANCSVYISLCYPVRLKLLYTGHRVNSIFSILLFGMIFMSGFSSQVMLSYIMMTSVMDKFKFVKKRRYIFLVAFLAICEGDVRQSTRTCLKI